MYFQEVSHFFDFHDSAAKQFSFHKQFACTRAMRFDTSGF